MTNDLIFDCFLSHNSCDKPAARAIKNLIVKNGLAVWLGEDELTPGTKWQDGLEQAIKACRSVAVLVGPSGEGSWQSEEVQAALNIATREELRVFAVLLPGLKDSSNLSIFLRNRTYVDLRRTLDDPLGVTKLIWGITGTKPTSGTEQVNDVHGTATYEGGLSRVVSCRVRKRVCTRTRERDERISTENPPHSHFSKGEVIQSTDY